MNWILFYREHDAAHYFFTGNEVIAASPHGIKQPFEHDYHKAESRLRAAAETPRVRSIEIEKVRYHVAARGQFVEP